MLASERRTARRFVLNVSLQLQLIQTPSLAPREVKAMNISTRGVYFTTDLPLLQGQLVQVFVQMPKEISGNVVNARRFTGRVAHVHPNGFADGISGVGVQFLYYGDIAVQLHEQEQANSEARSIQKALLPKEIPQLPGYEIATAWKSARVVGGDYFDVLPLGADALGLCIADVAGKGFSAALLMSNLQASVRGLAAPSLSPNELCLRLNALLHRNMEGDRFITFFYAQLDGPARRLSYVNAGHNPPIVLHRDGSHHRLKEGGGVLGVFSEQTFESGIIHLQSGDRVILFTDGVTEAGNPGKEEFGEQRLLEVLGAHRTATPAEIKNKVLGALADFNRSNWHDDVTLLILSVS
jgi:sigma-B regulation protein RsbU (phosphoserine phosphatase)